VPVERFPLVGSYVDRKTGPALTDTARQAFTNCYPVLSRNPITGKAKVQLVKRLGMTVSSDVSAGTTGALRGSTMWTGRSSSPVAVFSFLASGPVVKIVDQSATQIGGDISGVNNCSFIAETVISGTAHLTATLHDTATAAAELWYYPDGGAWTQNTDSDLPSNIQIVHCHKDGYQFFITKNGNVWNTDLNSVSAVTATSFINAQSMPDQGVGVVNYRNFIVAFGDYSYEMFYNAGNASGSPLSRVTNSARRIGAIRGAVYDQQTIRVIGDTIYWLGVDAESGHRGIYRMDGAEAQKISDPYIDLLLGKGVILGVSGAFSLHGLTHIAFGTASSAVCYCVEFNFWWFFAEASGSVALAFCGKGGDASVNQYSYAVMSGSKKVWGIDQYTASPTWQDNSVAFTMTAQTDPLDHGTHHRKFFRSLAVIGDTQASTSNVGVSYSDDDYSTFSSARNIDMSATERRLVRLGSSRRRAWKFTHSSNTDCRLEEIELEYDVGVH